MNKLVYSILGVAVVVGLFSLAVYIQNVWGNKKGKAPVALETVYPHGNPHHGSETFVAESKPDAYYRFYGVPNFPL